MTLFHWEDEYNVGNDIVDSEHQKIIELINEVYDAAVSKSGDKIIWNILLELKSYAFYHFQEEESIIRREMPSLLTEHKKIHDNLKIQVNEFIDRYKNGNQVDIIEFLGFLIDWFLEHIQVVDKKLFVYINEK